MDMLVLFVALMIGAVLTMPIWSYRAKWKLVPCSACLGLAMFGALLVVFGTLARQLHRLDGVAVIGPYSGYEEQPERLVGAGS